MTYEEAEKKRRDLINRLAVKRGYKGKTEAKCVECIYDPTSPGTWRLQIQECTDTACPLYSVRPTSEYQDRDEEETLALEEA